MLPRYLLTYLLAIATGASRGGSDGGGPVEAAGELGRSASSASAKPQSTLPPIVMQAVIGVNFIADHLKQQDEFNKVLH